MWLSREIIGAKTFEMQNQILVDPRVANTHRSSFDIGQRHHRLVMEWTAFQRHQRQNFLSDHELYYYKAELTAMMLFGQLLNVKMTSMAGDSKKQSTAIPLKFRPVVPGGVGDAMGLPNLADQLTLFQPRGADYVHQNILAPPDFQTFRRPCSL